MKKNTIISLFIALSLFGFSNNSNAQTKSFDGPYVGVSMGKTRNDSIGPSSGVYINPANFTYSGLVGESKDMKESNRSLKLGYLSRFGGSNTILGVEIAKTYLNSTINSKGDVDEQLDFNVGDNGITSILNIHNYTTLTARIGQALNDKTLVSVNAGAARSKISQSHIRNRNNNNITSDTDAATETGYVYGLSGEYKLTPQLSLRADYEVVNFGDISRATTNAVGGRYFNKSEVKFDNVSIGLVYSF
jgi:opacity protein-like surface antigen